MKIRYYSERERADGTIYVVNPPKYVKQATGMEYRQFVDKDEAVSYSLKVSAAFKDNRREKEGVVYVDDTSVLGLVKHFMTTKEWQKLKPNSKINYRLMIDTSLDIHVGRSNKQFSEVYAKNVSPAMADMFFQTVESNYSPHRAISCVRVLRRVWNIGLRHRKVETNPFAQMEMQTLPSREVKWEPKEVALAIETADSMGYPNIGTMILLCYHTCQRPVDIRGLKWSSFDGEIFTIVQEKTGTRLHVEASGDILDRLSTHKHRPHDGYIVVNDLTGEPHARTTYSRMLREVRKEAGIRLELTMADLRRSGTIEMAHAGATEDELMSVTGHTSRQIMSTYVLKSRELASNAIRKRFS